MADEQKEPTTPDLGNGSGNLRAVDVVDLVLAEDKYYKPCIVRSYARFSYMPNGSTVLDNIQGIREDIARLTTRVIALEEFITRDCVQQILSLQNQLELQNERIKALEAKVK